jgi:anti-sigma factor RsiW
MGGVLKIDPHAHTVVDTLLPWYVNGALEGDEREVVRAHLEICASCREEAAWLRELHAACTAVDSARGPSNPLRNLRRHLEAGPASRSPQTPPRGAWRRVDAWARWGVAGSLVSAAIVIAAAVMHDSVQPALYRTLGAAGTSAYASGSVIVQFDPSTPEREFRRILRAADARVVNGPTQANAYILDIPAGKRGNAISELRKEHAVMLAEPLAPERAP